MEVLDLITGQTGFVQERVANSYKVMLRNLQDENEIDSARWFPVVAFLKRFKILKLDSLDKSFSTREEVRRWAEDFGDEWYGFSTEPDKDNACDIIEYYRHDKPHKIFKVKWKSLEQV